MSFTVTLSAELLRTLVSHYDFIDVVDVMDDPISRSIVFNFHYDHPMSPPPALSFGYSQRVRRDEMTDRYKGTSLLQDVFKVANLAIQYEVEKAGLLPTYVTPPTLTGYPYKITDRHADTPVAAMSVEEVKRKLRDSKKHWSGIERPYPLSDRPMSATEIMHSHKDLESKLKPLAEMMSRKMLTTIDTKKLRDMMLASGSLLSPFKPPKFSDIPLIDDDNAEWDMSEAW